VLAEPVDRHSAGARRSRHGGLGRSVGQPQREVQAGGHAADHQAGPHLGQRPQQRVAAAAIHRPRAAHTAVELAALDQVRHHCLLEHGDADVRDPLLACEAAFSLLAAPLLPRLGALGVSTWAAAIATPLLLLVAALTESPRAPTAQEALGLAWLAVAVTAGGFVLWYTAVGTLGVARAGLFAGVLPVSALLCSAALHSSTVGPQRLAGVLAVAAGISLGVRRAQLTAQPAAPSSSNARTTSGSNCVPAPARISAAACSQVNESR
jgi:hypothetical protein